MAQELQCRELSLRHPMCIFARKDCALGLYHTTALLHSITPALAPNIGADTAQELQCRELRLRHSMRIFAREDCALGWICTSVKHRIVGLPAYADSVCMHISMHLFSVHFRSVYAL